MCLENLSPSKSDLAVWVGVAITLLAVLVALLKEELQRFWRKPALDILAKTQPPDCNISLTTYNDPRTGAQVAQGNCYYLRLWVYNDGNLPATNVEVFAQKLFRETVSKQFVEDSNFMPMNLKWAHTGGIFRTRIGHKMGRHCDLGHISDPRLKSIHNETKPAVPIDRTVLALALEVAPFTLMHLLEQGNYKLQLIVAADNCRPKKKIVKIAINGNWYDKEKDMFENGVGITIE